MHVLIDGYHHRRSPGLGVTACGLVFHAQFSPVRPEQLVHPLSRKCGCFTAYELAIADARLVEQQP